MGRTRIRSSLILWFEKTWEMDSLIIQSQITPGHKQQDQTSAKTRMSVDILIKKMLQCL